MKTSRFYASVSRALILVSLNLATSAKGIDFCFDNTNEGQY